MIRLDFPKYVFCIVGLLTNKIKMRNLIKTRTLLYLTMLSLQQKILLTQ